MDHKRSLLLGCGNSREKKISIDGNTAWAGELTTLDMDPDCAPDFLMDYDGLGKRSWRHPFGKRLPFFANTFDEIGAFDTLEHVGVQGDWRGFFLEFGEYHRILKYGGLMYVIVPINADAFADPGHTRFFHKNHFGFLAQGTYVKGLEIGAAITDYRHVWDKNFDILYLEEQNAHHLAAVLRKA